MKKTFAFFTSKDRTDPKRYGAREHTIIDIVTFMNYKQGDEVDRCKSLTEEFKSNVSCEQSICLALLDLYRAKKQKSAI